MPQQRLAIDSAESDFSVHSVNGSEGHLLYSMDVGHYSLAMRYFTSLILMAATVGLKSCFLDNGGEPTVAKGILTNEITGEGVDGVPIEVWECYGLLVERCDSLTSTTTINGGQYELGFTTKKKSIYKLGVGRNERYQSSYIGDAGVILEEGKTNTIDLTTIPYQVLVLEIEISKQNKNYLNIDYTSDSKGSWLGGTIFLDTLSQHQSISTIAYVAVLPQRKYYITKTLCNRSGNYPGNYKYSDCETERFPSIYFPYQDTLRVKLE